MAFELCPRSKKMTTLSIHLYVPFLTSQLKAYQYYCRHLFLLLLFYQLIFGNGDSRAVLSQRVQTKVVPPIAHNKSDPAGGTLLPGFSLRPQFILPGNAEAIL